MAGLEGTIKTPVGTVQKKTALLVGGGVVVLAGIVYMRKKNATPAASTTGEIDPATGYVYGTPEDLAELATQGTGTSLGSAGGGGSSTGTGSGSIPSGANVGGSFTTNADWVQAVEQYMTDHNLVNDPTQLSAALGKYITGASVDPNDTNTISLIQQAIAVQNYPPVAGPNGFPPSINTHPGTSTPPVTTPGGTKPPTPTPKPKPKRRYVVVAEFVPGHVVWNSTLSGIAGKSGRSVSQLASWNGITNPNVIRTDSHIWIDPSSGFSGSVEWKG